MSQERKATNLAIIVVLAGTIAVSLYARNAGKAQKDVAKDEPVPAAVSADPTTTPSLQTVGEKPASPTVPAKALPKLVDLGAGKCVPCKMMEPILEELKEEYKGKFEVVFIDVWEDRETGNRYGVRVIPTQVFFDSEGKELFRHEGFYSKQEILAKWSELNIDLKETESTNPGA